MPSSSTTPKKIEVPKELAERVLSGELTIAQMVGLNQDTLYAIASVGHQFLQTGVHDKALSIYRGLVAASPRDSVFHCHLAATYVALERWEESLFHYGEALRYNTANIDALAGRGELLLRMKRMPDAVNDLVKAVKADEGKKRPSARRAAAMLMMLNEKVKGAVKKASAEVAPPPKKGK